MAAPLLALPALGKLGAMLGIGGKAAGAAKATQLAIPGLMGAGKAAGAGKMAASKGFMGKLGSFLNPAIPGQQFTTLDKVMRFGPDLGFGALYAAQTPGDLADKALAFGTVAGGGLLGGLGSAGAVRHFAGGRMSPETLAGTMNMADMFGSIAGDFAAQPVGDAIARGKDKLMGGRGETAFERMGAEQQQQMRNQIEQEVLSQYGMMPGQRYGDLVSNMQSQGLL